MPAHRTRPTPPARMVQLLAERKRELLAEHDELTVRQFEAAWDEAWQTLIAERGFPHATFHRRQWWTALLTTKSEARAAFLDRPTMFARVSDALLAAAGRQGVQLTVDDLPTVFIGAIAAGYPVTDDAPPGVQTTEGVAA